MQCKLYKKEKNTIKIKNINDMSQLSSDLELGGVYQL